MKEFIENYRKNFLKLVDSITITDKKGRKFDNSTGLIKVCNIVKKQADLGGKVFFIGNGGSAAIASHMAIDFWKNGKMQSMAFNDSALLTCIGNDFGYSSIFEKPIEFFASDKDILFAISSSGKSENILKGVRAALTKKSRIITLSGFNKNNPLSRLGAYNFHVPSKEYGPVEIMHQYICHFILDTISQKLK